MGRSGLILLDTHVVLWLAFEPDKVSHKAHKRINEARSANEGLAISEITLLELATMASKGRFHVAMKIEQFLEEVEATFAVLPISGKACARILQLSSDYPRDPADRIIGATALTEGLTLITADQNIIRSSAVPCIW
jgi:PIN domain nuclease of toxin-antitoxin system